MQIEITPELAETRTALRRFTTEKLEPIALEIDRTGEVPPAALNVLRTHGYLGMRLPEEFGGGGFDLPTYCLALEEFGRSHRVFTLLLDATSGLNPIAIVRFGTDAQKKKYVAQLANGTLSASFALTEPEAGSDAQAIRTRAERREGGWALTGRKHYISGAHHADVVLVMAVTDPEKRARGGITAFLVDKGTKGLVVARAIPMLAGQRTYEVVFEDCRVHESQVLGRIGAGFAPMQLRLTVRRLQMGSWCIGMAQRALDMLVEHANQRVTFGQKLADRQAIQWWIADAATKLHACRLMVMDAAVKQDEGRDVRMEASMIKVFATEMATEVIDHAQQAFGAMGVTQELPLSWLAQKVRTMRVYEGPSEVHRMVIARRILGGR